MENGHCQICKNSSNNQRIEGREMMFGLRDRFQYLECARCGSLQLVTLPEDPAKYYPGDYYPEIQLESRTTFKRRMLRRRANYCLTGQGLLGRALTWIYG